MESSRCCHNVTRHTANAANWPQPAPINSASPASENPNSAINVLQRMTTDWQMTSVAMAKLRPVTVNDIIAMAVSARSGIKAAVMAIIKVPDCSTNSAWCQDQQPMNSSPAPPEPSNPNSAKLAKIDPRSAVDAGP
jgi:hypothetical protein